MTYLLVPGAGGSAWYRHRVAALLRDRGRPVVAVDLPSDDDTAGHLVALSRPEALAGRQEYRVAAVQERARG